ncbi:hypothetical protein [Chitinophaga sancti]|uniref:Uncharacterized protein n=1 Tax=Chitinophaga sancti TaxID=1004 RepID=A0A1K1S169_9BACT|nr:hypothetical protein [Chitinophaga sancti]WQD59734.1 hypothetical protein U0033_17740 [Chitinophaga sancti]WQG88135.1 hypothetical protein SR876_24725 [Chitinophaga sancti]SFW78054.1 hypothetical protein SAMN05661012_04567 [Chitinophaga sancti]
MYCCFCRGPLPQKITYNYTEIPAAQYTHCKGTKYLSTPGQFKVKAGKLVIPIAGKSPKVFKNGGEIFTYEYLGDLMDSKLSLVKCWKPNSIKMTDPVNANNHF